MVTAIAVLVAVVVAAAITWPCAIGYRKKVVETKGGFDRSGNSQDIDIFTPKKFAVLKDYLERYGLKGGIVRYDEKSEELCICMDSYSNDINSDSWVVLSDILK